MNIYPHVRTHLVSVLRGDENGFCNWSGIKCATWVAISRPTTLRSFFSPLGNRELLCVEEGNQMAARTALLLLLVGVLSGVFVVEQPSSSLLFRHPRLQWVCGIVRVTCQDSPSMGTLGSWGSCSFHIITNMHPSSVFRMYIVHGPQILSQVFRCNFWMAFFNSRSPKRTSLWSNSRLVSKFWLGKLTKKVREEQKKKYPNFQTTVKYKDAGGRTRFHGSKQLRSTQNLVCTHLGMNWGDYFLS